MSLKISNNSLFTKHYIIVDSDGIKLFEGALSWGAKRHRFQEIECVLLAPDHKLSIQIEQVVFTIPTSPENEKHQTVIRTLVQEVQRSAAAGEPAAR